MKARNGILALLAVLALAGCGVGAAPTEPGTIPRLSEGGPGTLGSGNSTTADTTAARNIITIGSGN